MSGEPDTVDFQNTISNDENRSLECIEVPMDVVLVENFSSEKSELFDNTNRKKYTTGSGASRGFVQPKEITNTHYNIFTGDGLRYLKTKNIRDILQNISSLEINFIVGSGTNGGNRPELTEDLNLKTYDADDKTIDSFTIFKVPDGGNTKEDVINWSADPNTLDKLKKSYSFEIYEKADSQSEYDIYGIVSVKITSSTNDKDLKYRTCQLRNLLKYKKDGVDANIDFMKFKDLFDNIQTKNDNNITDYNNLKKYFNKFYYNVIGNISIKNDNLDTEIAKHKLEIKYRLNDIYIKSNRIEILKLLITGLLLSLLVIILNKYLVVELPVINIISLIMTLFIFLIMIRIITNSNRGTLNFREFNYSASPLDKQSFWDKFKNLLLDLVPWSSSPHSQSINREGTNVIVVPSSDIR